MDYQLLDYGYGRKLERFGKFILDRPAPVAAGYRPQKPELWSKADCRFIESTKESEDEQKSSRSSSRRNGSTPSRQSGWQDNFRFPATWTISVENLVFELKRTPVGHLGVFIEQADNWNWIAQQCAAPRLTPFRVLNLFAYTGGSSMAAACANPGVVVTHVDSAANTVQWARTNALLTQSRLEQVNTLESNQKNNKADNNNPDNNNPDNNKADLSIRWITEDARKFTAREIKRGNKYEAIILDPPSYGHGTKGESWKISEDLPPLLDSCLELTDGAPEFILLTAHSPDFTIADLAEMIRARLGRNINRYKIQQGYMQPYSPNIIPLNCGDYVRVTKITQQK